MVMPLKLTSKISIFMVKLLTHTIVMFKTTAQEMSGRLGLRRKKKKNLQLMKKPKWQESEESASTRLELSLHNTFR